MDHRHNYEHIHKYIYIRVLCRWSRGLDCKALRVGYCYERMYTIMTNTDNILLWLAEGPRALCFSLIIISRRARAHTHVSDIHAYCSRKRSEALSHASWWCYIRDPRVGIGVWRACRRICFRLASTYHSDKADRRTGSSRRPSTCSAGHHHCDPPTHPIHFAPKHYS